VRVIPLGVSLPGTRERTQAETLRIGFVGRLVREKGAHLAVEAFAQVGAGLDASLELVGAGPEEPELRERARRLHVGERISFAGAVSQDEALRRIAGYDVLVVPSVGAGRRREQFGRVAAQAFAAGTPVLAARSGALAEVVDGCGELFRAGDAGDLAEKLTRLLREPERRNRLGELGRRRAETLYSWGRVADQMNDMYREVLGHG
jgi:glycosyltransferase involved in cell wall biosynthesis